MSQQALLLAPKDYVSSAEALSGTYTKVQAEQYTRWLATHHYENFHVVSFLLPIWSLSFATEALGGERETNSLVWLLIRPLPRPAILIRAWFT